MARSIGAEIGSSAVIGPRGDVYLGTADGAVYALDGATGSIEFEYSTGGGVLASCRLVRKCLFRIVW